MTVMFTYDYLISTVGVLMSVAFFTLLERKLMGLSHYRKGPSKVILYGVSQPMADAIKLMTKEMIKMSSVKVTMFLMGPVISLGVMLLLWTMFEYSFTIVSAKMKIIMIFTLMSLSIYGMLLMSWGSNSKYATMGGHRAVAQVMSYEVCMFITVLVVLFSWSTYSTYLIVTMQQGMWIMVSMLPLSVAWIMLCLAESNRTPFDMAEGESEIVSGFNIEYGGGVFALIFISEYGMMIMLSFVTSVFFLSGSMLMMKTLMVMFMFVWTRCSFPRVRYDMLMMLSWKMALPFTLAMMTMVIMVYSIKFLLNP